MYGAGVIGRVPTFGVGAGVVGRVVVQSPLGGCQPPEFAVKVSPVREFLHVTSAIEFIESAGGGVKP